MVLVGKQLCLLSFQDQGLLQSCSVFSRTWDSLIFTQRMGGGKKSRGGILFMLLFSPYVLSLCDSMGYSVPVFPGLHYLLKFMSINSVMLFNHLILCHHLLILPSVFPSIWSFLMSWLFVSSSQNIAASPLASILPMNIQGKFPIGLTCLISLQSKGLSRVFSTNTIWKHQFFNTQPSLCSNSYILTWLLEKLKLWPYGLLLAKWCLWFSTHCLDFSWLFFQRAAIS